MKQKIFEFKVDTEIKQEYLNSKPTGTANSNGYILVKVDQYENLSGKPVYNLTVSELDEMFVYMFQNKSKKTLDTKISVIRKYIDFCISKGIVPHMENRLNTFIRSEVGKLVSQQAVEFRYISPEELSKALDGLFNEQDRALILCPYYGIKGRPTLDGSYEEIINLQVNEKNKDYKNNALKLEKNNGNTRYIQVDENLMNILVEAKNQEYYTSGNGQENIRQHGGFRKIIINKVGNYVFRNTGKNKFEPVTPSLINARIQRIQEWVGNQYLTIQSLYTSGMITMAKKIYAEKGSLTSEDYQAICERFDYGSGDPKKYVSVLKDTVEQYL